MVLFRVILGCPHAAQVARLEAAPVAGDQLCRQRRHNLLPIPRTLVVQDFAVDLLSDAPKQKHSSAVRLTRQRAAERSARWQFLEPQSDALQELQERRPDGCAMGGHAVGLR